MSQSLHQIESMISRKCKNFFILYLIMLFYTVDSEAAPTKINWSEVQGSFYYEGVVVPENNYELQLLGDFPHESQLLARYPFKPGDIVFDVGAHIGRWARLALQFSPFILLYSFEPGPQAFEALKDTRADAVDKLFNLALSNRLGEDTFFLLDSGTFLSGLISRPFFAARYRQIQVPLETIDHFCEVRGIEKIEYLKIDTEGAELRILQGAHKMLSEHKIRALQFEYGETTYDAGVSLKQLIQLLHQEGYAVFRMEPSGLILINSWENSFENYKLGDFFAILYSEVPSCKALAKW